MDLQPPIPPCGAGPIFWVHWPEHSKPETLRASERRKKCSFTWYLQCPQELCLWDGNMYGWEKWFGSLLKMMDPWNPSVPPQNLRVGHHSEKVLGILNYIYPLLPHNRPGFRQSGFHRKLNRLCVVAQPTCICLLHPS